MDILLCICSCAVYPGLPEQTFRRNLMYCTIQSYNQISIDRGTSFYLPCYFIMFVIVDILPPVFTFPFCNSSGSPAKVAFGNKHPYQCNGYTTCNKDNDWKRTVFFFKQALFPHSFFTRFPEKFFCFFR